MKRFALCLFLALSLGLSAQELKVTDFRADLTMTDAAKFPKKDANGVNCGLIRLGLVLPDAQFEGDIISSEYKDGEWWIYMMKDANWITIKSKRYLPLRHEFEPIRSNVTYVMLVDKPQIAYDGPTGTIKIECNIKDADVYVDGEKISAVTPCEYKGPEGTHEVLIRSKGYNDERQTVNVLLNKKVPCSMTLRPAGTFQLDGISYEMVKVAGGSFMMGSKAKPEDKNYPLNFAQPQHEVILRNYAIGKTEVTQALWEKVMGSNPSLVQGPNLPVSNVSYTDCLEFIRRLNRLTGQHFRLPTEAEWEFAAYAPVAGDDGLTIEGKVYPWSGYHPRDMSKRALGQMQANFVRGRGDMMGVSGALNDKYVITNPVDAFYPNDFGLYNMAGNVNEWVMDVYRETTFQDASEYNSFRGNIYSYPVVDEDGKYATDSLGRVKIAWTSKEDKRDVRDGDRASLYDTDFPLIGDTTGLANLEERKIDITDILAPRITKKTRVYKGGSWADRIYWLNPSTRRYLDQDQASSKIGFRCAMSALGDQIPPTPIQ